MVTLRDHPSRHTGDFKASSLGPRRAQPSRASARPGRCPMATTSTSTAVIAVEPVFTEPGRLALAGFLAGYTGLTREAYALDLRQYASWCQRHHLPLLLEDHPATPANRKPRGCGGTRRSPGPV